MTEAPIPGPNRDPYPEALWTHPQPEIDTEVNLGDEGLTDGDTIDPYLDEHVDSNTRVVIPNGTYDLDSGSSLSISDSYEDVHIKGESFGGVELQKDNTDWAPTTRVGDGSVVIYENLDLTGTVDDDDWSIAAHGTGELIFKRVRLLDMGRGQGNNESGWYMDSLRPGDGWDGGHSGTLRMLWCQCEFAGNNGLYADGPIDRNEAEDAPNGHGYGQVIVVGGYYKNCIISHVRIGPPYTTLYRTTIHSDSHPSTWDTHPDYNTNRGLRVRKPDGGSDYDEFEITDFIIDDCDIRFDDGEASPMIFSSGNISSEAEDWHGGLIRDLRVYNDGDGRAIAGDWPSGYNWENIHLTGSNTEYDSTVDDSAVVTGSDAEEASADPWWGDEVDSGDGDGGNEEDGTDGSEDGTNVRELTIRSGDTAINYVFRATGEISPLRRHEYPANRNPPGDFANKNADGSWTAVGHSGGNSGDSYEVEGDFMEFNVEARNADEPDFFLVVDGEEVSIDELRNETDFPGSDDDGSYEQGYDDGYETGYDDGYTDGESDGHDAGYHEGYDDGYSDGETDGRDSGYEEGYDDGYADGQEDASDGSECNCDCLSKEDVRAVVEEEFDDHYLYFSQE